MADRTGEMLLRAYRVGTHAFRPFVPLVISRRVAGGKENAARTGERYGRPSRERPEGRLVWVHAASVGETNAVLPLIRRIAAAGFPVLFTTTTITSAVVAERSLPEGAFHQFGPLDIPAYVERFLDYWRPYFAVFVESELWPNAIARLEQAVVPCVVVNGRMSDRSFRRWQRLTPLARALLSRMSLVLARSDEDARRFRVLGTERIEVVGDLKFDAEAPAAHAGELARLRPAIGNRKVWAAASTHPGEEEVVAAAHRLLRERAPDVLTIVVPRHPSRGDAVRDMLAAQGLAVAQRSRGALPSAETDVYLADTLGEMGLVYSVAGVAFLGGSLTPQGGHNPLEALRLDTAVVHGPHTYNFVDLYAVIDRTAPDALVADAGALAIAVASRFDAPAEAVERTRAMVAALSPFSGALDATMLALRPYLSGRYYSP